MIEVEDFEHHWNKLTNTELLLNLEYPRYAGISHKGLGEYLPMSKVIWEALILSWPILDNPKEGDQYAASFIENKINARLDEMNHHERISVEMKIVFETVESYRYNSTTKLVTIVKPCYIFVPAILDDLDIRVVAI